jgi:excisionase family DNA binding protein
MSRFLTVRQVAEQLKLSVASIYQLCAEGKLKHYRLGLGRGTIRISEEQLQQFLKEAESRGESVPPALALRDITYQGPSPS